VVLDRQSGEPLDHVFYGIPKPADETSSKSNNLYTEENGKYIFSKVSGGFRKCPDVVLYFNKQGYTPIKRTFMSISKNDTVYLDTLVFNPDSSIQISRLDFDQKVELCTRLLREKPLKRINDEEHIEIMMCLNTLMMRDLHDEQYDSFNQAVIDTKYISDIISVYPNWIPNRGIGFYFPDLQMELYGTPRLYAYYDVQN
jgi:hypothetical protein